MPRVTAWMGRAESLYPVGCGGVVKQHSLPPLLPFLQQPVCLENFAFQKRQPWGHGSPDPLAGAMDLCPQPPSLLSFLPDVAVLPKEHRVSHGEMVDSILASQRFTPHSVAVPSALWRDLASSLTPVGSAFERVMRCDSRNAWSWDAPEPGSRVSIAIFTQLAPTAGLSFCRLGWSGCTLPGNLDVPG